MNPYYPLENLHSRLEHMPAFRGLSVPVHRASTIGFSSMEDFLRRSERLYDGFMYGLYGTPTTRVLEQEIARLEGGAYCVTLPSGLSAVNLPLLALLETGDHVLVAANAYGPTREFCQAVLARYGIDCTEIPADADSVLPWLTPRTKLVLLESPGSYTMEVQEISRICKQAHDHGALVVLDNTWGLGLTCAFDHGVDIVSTALSKYASGHSDVCMGSVTVRDRNLYETLKYAALSHGQGVSSDDASLVLRGLATFAVRVEEHARRGRIVADWFSQRPEVSRVIYPGRPEDPQHARYSRYFQSGHGLLSVLLAEPGIEAARAVVEALQHFQIGASWGGTHSLVAPIAAAHFGWLPEHEKSQWILRFHIGLEPLDPLLNDLESAFARLNSLRYS